MPEWLEWILGLGGAGAAGSLAPKIFDYVKARRDQDVERRAQDMGMKKTELEELRAWRGELIEKQTKLESILETLRVEIDLWQQRYFEVSTQNELLKAQIAALVEQNEDLRRMVAALEDENEALQARLLGDE